jgi:hypothetical protein
MPVYGESGNYSLYTKDTAYDRHHQTLMPVKITSVCD